VSYDHAFANYDWVYVTSEYYDSGASTPFGSDTYFVYNDWHATAGRWVAGLSADFYDVRGYHSFQHGGTGYGIPSSVSYGQCFPNETSGC
jgi:hypothetical protein